MVRIVKLTGKYYGYDMGDRIDQEELDNIEQFLSEGTLVILADCFEDFIDEYGEELTIVDPDEEE